GAGDSPGDGARRVPAGLGPRRHLGAGGRGLDRPLPPRPGAGGLVARRPPRRVARGVVPRRPLRRLDRLGLPRAAPRRHPGRRGGGQAWPLVDARLLLAPPLLPPPPPPRRPR